MARHLTAMPVRAGAMQRKPIVAAIDFGTTYSGYAFQTRANFEENPTKIEAANWARTGSNIGISLKTTSSILFDKHQQFHSFGQEADQEYNKLAAEGQHWDWFFFKRFKMALYKSQNLTREMKIKSVSTGQEMPAIVVITETIRYLKDHLVNEIKSKDTGIQESEIHWVLTVPAIWDDSAKQFMREAAINAEIDTDKLLLSLEPEAASLFCRYLPFARETNKAGASLVTAGVGDRYMILDVGGGTVDITVHEVQINEETKDVTLREMFKANGGDWGGLKVDESFTDLLQDIIGPDVMEVLQTRYREDFMEFMDAFEIKKRKVAPDMDSREIMTVPLSFVQTYKELNNVELEDEQRIKEKYNGKITFSKNKMRFDPEILKGLFTETVDQICALASEYFDQIREYNIRTILMVGGFSESRMLQDKVRSTFPSKRLIIPDEAGLCVLKGAVLYGHNPSMITARVSKFTYGIEACKQFEPALDPYEKRVIRDRIVLCKNYFSIHAKAGQEFQVDEMVGEHEYVAHGEDATELQIDVYTTPHRNPRYIDDEDSRKIGEMRVPVGRSLSGDQEMVKVQFVFGDTELKVVAWNVENGQKIKDARFEFLK
ncbi:heat shock 70 kDa protein 12A-like isoform X2 [Mya arenaria]|nr:heat shock 70 kDa protein 12A-like isoform X2 [Mya arenaria]